MAGTLVMAPKSVTSLPCARMRSRGRVFGLSVSLSVCPPLFGLFARSRHSQGLFIHSTGRSGGKVAYRWSAIEKNGLEARKCLF